MKFTKFNLVITLITSSLILIPSLALISFSQTNDTSSDNLLPDDEVSSNQSSFSDWSRELGQNQTESDDDSDEDNE